MPIKCYRNQFLCHFLNLCALENVDFKLLSLQAEAGLEFTLTLLLSYNQNYRHEPPHPFLGSSDDSGYSCNSIIMVPLLWFIHINVALEYLLMHIKGGSCGIILVGKYWGNLPVI